ncbi:MFS transporter [Paenibacillus solisilvae]|uniref:MFS transporter n=1 Tax=Paenibacillus solisilvae TaxID=2486751 RepID=A0ABW0VVS1_9BACL
MKKVVWLGCAAYFLIGLATVVLGALLPEMLQDYGRNYSSGGQLVFTQFAGFFIGVVAAPRVSERLGYQRTILQGVLLLVIVHTALLFHPHWYLVMLLAALNGFGFGMTQTAIGTFLLESTNNGAVTMSRLEVSFGIGALLMPIVSSFLIARFSWSWSFAIVIVFAIINLALWSMKFVRHDHAGMVPHQSPAMHVEISSDKADKLRFSLPKLAFFICFVFLYVGIETSIVNFLPSIFVQHFNLNTSEATLSVTFFWIAMVIGRIFAGVIAEKFNYSRFLMGSTLGAIIFLICIALVKNTIAAFTLVLLIGLFLSGIFAIVIVLANRVFMGNTKQTTSIMIASGGVGGAVLPLLTGWSMDHFQATKTIWVIIVCALLMFLCLLHVSRNTGTSSTTLDEAKHSGVPSR